MHAWRRSIFSTYLITIFFDSSSNPTQEDITIPRRPTPKSLESLSLTLQKLEQSSDPEKDDDSIVELKRVLLNRIADLELSRKLVTENDESDQACELAEVVPSPLVAEDTTHEAPREKTPLEKLD